MSKKIEFGVFSPQAAQPAQALLQRAALCEKLGYHSMWLVDHFFTRGMPELDHVECLAMMSALAARTEKLRIGSLVICNSYRNPALLAKSLSTIDQISNGRLEVGLGAGWMDEEYRAYGYEFPPISVRLAQLEETLQVLKLMFTEKKPSFKGRYYSIDGAYNSPKPVQKPHPPITIGGSGEKVMLKLVAKYADRWNCPAGYDDFERKHRTLLEHCRAVGRDPEQVAISEQILVALGQTEEEAARKWKAAAMLGPFVSTGIKGTPPQIVEQLRARVKMGVTLFTVFFSDFAPPATLELFAHEVAAAFK